jgi:hypothetical protein
MFKMYGAIQRPVGNLPQGNLMPVVYHDLDDALGAARNLSARGGTALLIEGDDGTHITEPEIAKIIRDRGIQLNGRPKVY